MNSSPRTQVLVIGDRQVEPGPFDRRRLTLRKIGLNELRDAELANNACSVLLAPPPGKFGLIYSYFEDHFYQACEMGLLTAVYLTDKLVQVSAIRDETYGRFSVGKEIEDEQERKKWVESLPWVFIGQEDWAIADVIARHDPGPRLGSAVIIPDGFTGSLDLETEKMLKRAFHNANRITVKPLSGGRTAKEAFCIHANLGRPGDSNYGPQPMPFFFKMGTAWKIEKERKQYRDTAEPFIPFYLRPSLVASRCVRTLSSAALACNFVECAAPLRSALQSGQASGVIFSLFEVTLRGLRMHTLSSPPRSGVLESFLNTRVKAGEIEAKHPTRIDVLRSHGEFRKPDEIMQILKQHSAKLDVREGHYHGDLHYGNMMARNGDAIVIDFGSMEPFGPLYADPAMLEVSLVFGTDKHDAADGFDAWREFVDDVYNDPLRPPQPKGHDPKFAWLHRALRELRHIIACSGIGQVEAIIILAGCMLRYARHSPLDLQSELLNKLAEAKRAYALVTAYRLCNRLGTPNATG